MLEWIGTNWGVVALALPGIASALWLFFRERSLEKLKANLRRELETELKNHETRLRVNAELALRLHERSADLLREVQNAETQAYERIRDYATAALYRAAHPEHSVDELHTRASECMQKLQAAAWCSPPEAQNVREALSLYIRALNDVNAWVVEPPARADINSRSGEHNEKLLKAKTIMYAALRSWNENLWRVKAETMSLLESTSTSIVSSHAGGAGSKRNDREG